MNHGPDEDFGSSAVLLDAGSGRQVLVAGQKTGVVHGFDPDQNGKIVWQTRIGKGSTLGGVSVGHRRSQRSRLRSAIRYRPSEAGIRRRNVCLECGYRQGRVAYSAPKPACLGKPGCTAAQLAPPSLIEGAVFAGSMDGHLRAWDMASGKIIWDFDATQTFPTTDGIKANGGSFSSTGPTIADGCCT